MTDPEVMGSGPAAPLPIAEAESPTLTAVRSTAGPAWFVALLGAFALLLGRAVSPALIGVWVGLDDMVTIAQLVAATATQLFALLAVGLTVGLLAAVTRSAWPVGFRFYAVGAVCLVTLAVGSAIFLRLPEISGVVAGAAAGALAVLVGRYGVRSSEARAAALVVGGLGLSCLVRMAAIGTAYAAETAGSVVLEQAAGVLATLELLVQLAVAMIAWGWLAWRPKQPVLLLVGALVLASAAAVVALGVLGAAPDAVGLPVLANRAIGRLITSPAPYVPAIVQGFVKILCWVLAVAVLLKTWRVPTMTAAVSLALTAQAAFEAPLGAMALSLAALLVALGADPGRPTPVAARPR